jgi:nitrite reductase/ring-hydroxylating ferredoxin subunit
MIGSHAVCALADLEDPGSRAFSIGSGNWPLRGFVVRVGGEVSAFMNRCPHAGHPLNWRPDDFLTEDKQAIICNSHGALFDRVTGLCFAGPCTGRALRAIPVHIKDGFVIVDVDHELERAI